MAYRFSQHWQHPQLLHWKWKPTHFKTTSWLRLDCSIESSTLKRIGSESRHAKSSGQGWPQARKHGHGLGYDTVTRAISEKI